MADPALEVPRFRRQDGVEERFGAGRPAGGIAADRSAAGGGADVGEDVLQENGVEGGGLVVIERRDEAGLGAAGDRRLGHDRHATARHRVRLPFHGHRRELPQGLPTPSSADPSIRQLNSTSLLVLINFT